MSKSYSSAAEDYFTECGLSFILFREGFIDERGRHREGDFRLPDGRLIEVKTDTRCFSAQCPTERIPVEIEHPEHFNRYGWYQHCIENDVSFLIFCCCQDAECTKLARHIIFPMDSLRVFVDEKMKDAAFMNRHCRQTKDGVKNLYVPLAEILSIPGTRQLFPVSDEEIARIEEGLGFNKAPVSKEVEGK